MPKKKPFERRTDIQKIHSQWRKLNGLHDRAEWSAAVVRAATAAEIAVNLAIRAELGGRQVTDNEVIDLMLKVANGLQGKFTRLLQPLVKEDDRAKQLKKLWKIAEKINRSRNEIVHSGYFRSENHAKDTIDQCHAFVVPLVKIYEPNFELAKPTDESPKSD